MGCVLKCKEAILQCEDCGGTFKLDDEISIEKLGKSVLSFQLLHGDCGRPKFEEMNEKQYVLAQLTRKLLRKKHDDFEKKDHKSQHDNLILKSMKDDLKELDEKIKKYEKENNVRAVHLEVEIKKEKEKNKIKYLVGDATKPEIKGKKIIAHICNNSGKWGKGFVLAISKRWKQPEQLYRSLYEKRGEMGFIMGETFFSPVEPDIWVGNMIAQKGIYQKGINEKPLDYKSLYSCLDKVGEKAIEEKAVVCMPKIGTGLAQGDWVIIEDIIEKTLIEKGIEVYIYELPPHPIDAFPISAN